jgi:hypothetical protein
LEQGLAEWRRRFADRMFGLTEEAALAYGEIMGQAVRRGHAMSAPDAMIAAIEGAWPRAILRILKRQVSYSSTLGIFNPFERVSLHNQPCRAGHLITAR